MKNITSLILIILAIGLFYGFTNGKIQQIQTVEASNAGYLTAIQNSQELIKERDAALAGYNALSDEQKNNVNEILPDNVDNIRLIIDVQNIASRHGISLQGLSTSADTSANTNTSATTPSGATPSGPGSTSSSPSAAVNAVTISFTFDASYQNFLAFLKDVESSLRILDVSTLTVTANPSGTYTYAVQLQTYWLSQ